MKKLVLSLLCASAMSIPASAFALPAGAVFDVSIPNGPVAAFNAGQIVFDLDADTPPATITPLGRSCRYYFEWDNSAIIPISADGFVLEAKAHGAASCFTNAMSFATTIVQNDPVALTYGFDRFQQFRLVNRLLLGEDSFSGELNGLVQFDSTVGGPVSFMTNSLILTVAGP